MKRDLTRNHSEDIHRLDAGGIGDNVAHPVAELCTAVYYRTGYNCFYARMGHFLRGALAKQRATMTLFRELITISFEAYTVYDDIDCDIAYGMLRIEGIVAPALRLCMHRPLVDLAVKLYGDFVVEVKKAGYYLYIPPHCYITYTDTPDVLLLLRPLGATLALFLVICIRKTCIFKLFHVVE